jgi:hypothetical protein
VCCAWIAKRQTGVPPVYQHLVHALWATQLAVVSESFCDLQEARHGADYDHLTSYSKATTLAHVEDARRSLGDLASAPQKDRDVFFALLTVRTRPK